MMLRKTLGAGAVATLALAVPAPVAQAASTVVSSPSCGTVRVTNTSTVSETRYTMADNAEFFSSLPKGQSQTFTNVPAGSYMWESRVLSTGQAEHGVVKVARCNSTWPTRPADGDQDGDGRADVLGIHGSTGDLYYYRMTSTGLADGVKAGRGWSSMVFMRQVNDLDNGSYGVGNYLIAVHKDGTVWSYLNRGYGRFADGRKIGSGFAGWSNFTILPANNELMYGGHLLLASDGQTLHAFPLTATEVDSGMSMPVHEGWGSMRKTLAVRDMDGNHVAEVLSIDGVGDMHSWQVDMGDFTGDALTAPVRVGVRWGAMGIVASPGSVDGDELNDLIARNTNGNLYKYVNRGGRWTEGIQIGRNWNGIRLLA